MPFWFLCGTSGLFLGFGFLDWFPWGTRGLLMGFRCWNFHIEGSFPCHVGECLVEFSLQRIPESWNMGLGGFMLGSLIL